MKTINTQAQEIVSAKYDLKELQDAVVPVVGLFEAEGDNARPLVDLVKEVPGRLKAYVHEMVQSCVRQVLGLLRVYFLDAELGKWRTGSR